MPTWSQRWWWWTVLGYFGLANTSRDIFSPSEFVQADLGTVTVLCLPTYCETKKPIHEAWFTVKVVAWYKISQLWFNLPTIIWQLSRLQGRITSEWSLSRSHEDGRVDHHVLCVSKVRTHVTAVVSRYVRGTPHKSITSMADYISDTTVKRELLRAGRFIVLSMMNRMYSIPDQINQISVVWLEVWLALSLARSYKSDIQAC